MMPPILKHGLNRKDCSMGCGLFIFEVYRLIGVLRHPVLKTLT